MAITCQIYPCVRGKVDKNGEHPISIFFKRAQKLFDRDTAKAMYATINNKTFRETYGERLSFDENNEPTLESFLAVMGQTVDSQKLLENLNKEYGSDIYDYQTAEAKVRSFNNTYRFDDSENDYMATMERTDSGKYIFHIIRKSASAYADLTETIAKQKILDTIVSRLKELGVDVSFIQRGEGNSRYSTENARKTAQGLWALVQLVNGESVSAEAAEEAGHFAMAAFKDVEVSKRLEKLLQDENLRNTIVRSLHLEDENLGANPARELAGKLIGIAMRRSLGEKIAKVSESEESTATETAITNGQQEKKSGWRRLVDRFISHIKSFFARATNKITGRTIEQDIVNAENLAEAIANGFLTDSSSISVEQAIRTEETLFNKKKFEKINTSNNLSHELVIKSEESVRNQTALLSIMLDSLDKMQTQIIGIYERGYEYDMSLNKGEDYSDIKNLKLLGHDIGKIISTHVSGINENENKINKTDILDIANSIVTALCNIVKEQQNLIALMDKNLKNYTADTWSRRIYQYAKLLNGYIRMCENIELMMTTLNSNTEISDLLKTQDLSNALSRLNTVITDTQSGIKMSCLKMATEINLLFINGTIDSDAIRIAASKVRNADKKMYDKAITTTEKEKDETGANIWTYDQDGKNNKMHEKEIVLSKNGKIERKIKVTRFVKEVGNTKEYRIFIEDDDGNYFIDDSEISTQELLKSPIKDLTFFGRWLGSAADSDELGQLIHKSHASAQTNANQEMAVIWQKLEEMKEEARTKFGSDYRWMFQVRQKTREAEKIWKQEFKKFEQRIKEEWDSLDDENKELWNKNRDKFYDYKLGEFQKKWGEYNVYKTGKLKKLASSREFTGYLVCPWDYDAFEEDRKQFRLQCEKEFREKYTNLCNAYDKGLISSSILSLSWNEYFQNRYETEWKPDHTNTIDRTKSLDKNETFAAELGLNIIPSNQYVSSAWQNLSNEQKDFMFKYFSLKKELDRLLPDGTLNIFKAPQFRAHYISMTQNMKFNRERGWGSRIGKALRVKLNDMFWANEWDPEYAGMDGIYDEEESTLFKRGVSYEVAHTERVKNIPLYGIHMLPPEAKNLISTDIFSSTLQYAAMATNYAAMSDCIDAWESIHSSMHYRDGVYEKDETKAYSRIKDFLDRQVYAQDVNEKRQTRSWSFVYKTVKHMRYTASLLALGGNVAGGMVNTLSGHNELVKEAKAGQFFDMGDLRWAEWKYWRSAGSWIFGNYVNKIDKNNVVEYDKDGSPVYRQTRKGVYGGIGSRRKTDFISSFIHHFNILNENEYEYGGWTTEGGRQRRGIRRVAHIANKSMLYPYHGGDHWMQSMGFLAMGHKKKIYDANGKMTSLVDAYETTGFGDIQLKEVDGVRYWYKIQNGSKIDNKIAQKLEKTYVTLDNDLEEWLVKYGHYTKKEIYDASKSNNELLKSMLKHLQENIRWSIHDEAEFRQMCREVGNRMHGIYNFSDMTAAHNNIVYSAVLQMRGWMLGQLERRIGQRRYNFALKQTAEGSLITTWKVLSAAFRQPSIRLVREGNKNEDGTWSTFDINEIVKLETKREVIGNTIAALFFPYRKSTQRKLKQRGFDDFQIANLKRNLWDHITVLKHIAYLKLMTLMGYMFLPSDDEKKQRLLDIMRKNEVITAEQYNDWDSIDVKTRQEKIDKIVSLMGWDLEDMPDNKMSLEYVTEGLFLDDLNPFSEKNSFAEWKQVKKRMDEHSFLYPIISYLYYVGMRNMGEAALFTPTAWGMVPLGAKEAWNSFTTFLPIIASSAGNFLDMAFSTLAAVAVGGMTFEARDPNPKYRYTKPEGGDYQEVSWDFSNPYTWDLRTNNYGERDFLDLRYKYNNYHDAMDIVFNYKSYDDDKVKKLYEKIKGQSWKSDRTQYICNQIIEIGKLKSNTYGLLEKSDDYIKRPNDDRIEQSMSNKNAYKKAMKDADEECDQWINDNGSFISLETYLKKKGVNVDAYKETFYVEDKGTTVRAGNPKAWNIILKRLPIGPTRVMGQAERSWFNVFGGYEYGVSKEH